MVFPQIELSLLGIAAVIDTVLLFILFERVNRPQIADWLYGLLIGLWLVHASSFAHQLLHEVPHGALARNFLTAATCAGLLLLPCAMLHASLWMNFGKSLREQRYRWLYAPMLCLPWIAYNAWRTDAHTFVENVQPFARIYLAFVTLVNAVSIVLFVRASRRLKLTAARQFFPKLAGLLGLQTLVLLGYYAALQSSEWEPGLRVLLIVTPLLPALLFVWYSLNTRMLPLVMERTLVYGASVVMLLLLHRLLIAPLAGMIQSRANVDVLLIEGWILVGFILAWSPLRTRFREAVRYLISSNVHQVRDTTRRLSVEMSQLSWQTVPELVDWMCHSIVTGIEVDSACVWLEPMPTGSGSAGHGLLGVSHCESHADEVSDGTGSRRTTSNARSPGNVSSNERGYAKIYETLSSQSEPLIYRGQRLSTEVVESMERLNVMWAFRLHYRTIRGMVLLGPRRRCDRLADEQLTALSLLFEQFAATIHNRQLDLQRMRAERQSMQQEKLSVVGLLAGSLAHELRNPLSSMRTIATLLLEDMSKSDAHHQDVSMIVSEIDRLTQTTQRLLDYSRPPTQEVNVVDVDRTIVRLLHILEHLARSLRVQLDTSLNARCCLRASEATVSEILFNLIKNAIEASATVQNGAVTISSHFDGQRIRIVVADNGPGIAPEIQATMFEPFVTGKADGTGLGLYVVAERVRELDGTILCDSAPNSGTRFEVSVPAIHESHASTREPTHGSDAQ